MIRYYFKAEPKTLDEVYFLWGELKFALEFEGKIKSKKPING